MIRRRGLALVLSAGVLGVLAIMAMAFVTLSQMERRGSRQRLLVTQAMILARSGIEDAVARLAAGQEASAPGTAYAGEDWDRSGTLNGFEVNAQVLRPLRLDVADCPVRHALRPSFYVKSPVDLDAEGRPAPRLAMVDGFARGWSGSLGISTRAAYALKIEDESAKLNVNGGILDTRDLDADGIPDFRDLLIRPSPAPANHNGIAWNDQLVRLLNGLGATLGTGALGNLLVGARPLGGYRSMAEVQAVSGATTDLSPFLTVDSWSDPKVVRPGGFPGEVGVESLADVKFARRRLLPEVGGRPPVNLNAAAPEVLTQLLSGCRGTCWYREANPVNYTLSPVKAQAVAQAMVAFREGRDTAGGAFAAAGLVPGPFRSWAQVSAFCDALVPTVVSGFNIGVAHPGNLAAMDMIKSALDPNTRSNKELPDQSLWRWVDKTDLVVWGTEGSLGPTGTFRIGVVARITDASGRLLIEQSQEERVEVFRILRHTTQQDFVGGRTLSAMPRYLSLATLLLPGVPGTLGDTTNNVWWGGVPPGPGLAVVTYPCPPKVLPALASAVDGRIGLATYESPASNPMPGTLKFLYRADESLDADYVQFPGNGVRQVGPNGAALSPANLNQDVWPAAGIQPNTLYPDGLHSQHNRCPAYLATNIIPGVALPKPNNWVVVGMWVKTVFRCDTAQLSFSCLSGSTANSQFFMLGNMYDTWGIFGENTPSFYRQRVDARTYTSGAALGPGARWQLVTALVDTDHVILQQDVHITVKGLTGPGIHDPYHGGYNTPFDSNLGMNIAGPGIVFLLGGQDNAKFSDGKRGHHVVDEVALVDFGNNAALAVPNADAWALGRYRDGRYYKGNDGAYLSPQVVLPSYGPARLVGVQWTGILSSTPFREITLNNGVATPATGTPRALDPTLAGSRIEVELMDAGGTVVLEPLAERGRMDRAVGTFRYRVRFLPTPGWAPADIPLQPVLESPWFEDITFLWQGAEGPRVLGWGG